MEIVWSDSVDSILKIGKSLNEVGIDNWALSKIQALKVLDQFLESKISVLGGDVYENINGAIQSNYDSWCCEPLSNESKTDFINRSIKKARNYIEEYKTADSKNIFFVFVPNV